MDQHIEYAINKKRPWKTIVAQMMAINKWQGIDNLKIIDEYLKLYGVNVVIIHGDKDLILNCKNAQFMHDRISNSRFYLLKGEGHFVHVTKRGLLRLTQIINELLLNKSKLVSKL